MALSYKQVGELLVQTGGWVPEPPDTSSAKWIASTAGFFAGLIVFGLSAPTDFPWNLYFALIASLTVSGVVYGVIKK